MKLLINKVVAAAALTLASAAFCLAQTRTIEHEYSEFDAVSVSNGFKVTMVESENYKTSATVDDALESYVQCYVKARTLYIGLDEKAIPKEVKKQLKGKNSADPTLEVIVYMPVLNSLSLADNSTFIARTDLNSGKFKLDLKDNSSISNLTVNAESANINVTKKAKLSSIHIKADDVTVNGDGNGVVVLEYTAKSLEVNNAGSATLTINGGASKASVTTGGSANLSLSGKAESLKVSGKGNSSKIDASSLNVNTVEVSLDGAELNVTPGKTLELDLEKGATVNYAGDPAIKIVQIKNSTVTRK